MIVPLTDKVKVIRPLSPPRFPFSNSLYVDDEQKLMIDAGAGVSAYAELGPHTTDNVDKLEEISKEALKQIEEAKYSSTLKQEDTKEILHLGIAFCGKQIKVSYK